MSETRFTPGPWVFSKSNFLNCIEADSGKRLYDADDGMRAVAMVQACCASEKFADQEANRLANMQLVTAAPDLYAAVLLMVEYLRKDMEAEPRAPGHMLGEIHVALKKARGEL